MRKLQGRMVIEFESQSLGANIVYSHNTHEYRLTVLWRDTLPDLEVL